MDGKLFSQDFLLHGITSTPIWEQLSETALDDFHEELKRIYTPLSTDSIHNEANTEADIIEKVLNLLEWRDLTLKQVSASSKGRTDVPDFLLFASAEKKQAANAETKEDRRYRHGIAIIEAKKWMRPLDRGDATDRLDPGTPSNQILRYLSSVEVASERAVRWGMLTNGAVWRLYYQGARSRSEEFLEIDLASLLGVAGTAQDLFGFDARHGLKLFYTLFQRSAFLPQAWDNQTRTFHEYAFNEARLYEEKVSQDLGARVFENIFPQLADALAAGDPEANLESAAYLAELRDATLILLYRLLFIFYAEDRNLLPVKDSRYDNYALRTIRDDIAQRCNDNDIFSNSASRYWQHLGDLFRIISLGDVSIGMPAYNGGLFEENRSSLLGRTRVSDARFAPLLDDLSRSMLSNQRELFRSYINYRDLSVQHLGGIYERLLEYSLVVEELPSPQSSPTNGRGGEREKHFSILARPASFARKTSGSYYTHDGLVKLIIKEAVGPQIAERVAAFSEQLDEWKNKKELKPSDWEALEKLDPAVAMLELKICDPAMGSGHFLVTLVDYLADEILEAIASIELQVAAQPWAKNTENPHLSPLVARIKDIRKRILSAAYKERWAVTEAQLDDRHIVRRMILKRVIYGVDKNPMAVELAKVALWLHTFTVGAPLSFLDHHLRCGDSLFGGKIHDIAKELNKLKGGLLQQDDVRTVQTARQTMELIADLTDIDIAEAHKSKALMEQITEGLLPMQRTLDFLQAKRWAGKAEQKAYEATWAGLLAQEYGDNLLDSVAFLQKRTIKLPSERQQLAHATMQKALQRAEQEHFLHWELAFPTIWQDGQGGFDAIIGNPPWDRIKLQEVEWFAERRPAIALATKAADRKKLITALQANNDALWLDYTAAAESAEIAARIARESGNYPLLSGGDINLYSLFVEKASQLIKPNGLVGLLTPSGITADKGASAFFRTLTLPSPSATLPPLPLAGEGQGVRESEGARLIALFDFENRKTFFPDVHASFKFCALIFGGAERTVASTRCAFYVHQLEELQNPERILHLTAADFSAVNPNTGSAPIFRTQRDAVITTAIYRRQPVLVLHPSSPALLPPAGEGSLSPSPVNGRGVGERAVLPRKVWPVRYCRMFDMTNDSNLFMRRDELERDGWYPVGGNRWKKGEAEAVPLYEGKMAQMYDHRAANVVLNHDNLHRAAQQEATTLEQHTNPQFAPTPQFWVEAGEVRRQFAGEWVLGFKEITAPTNMRSMIACIAPGVGFGNKLPLWLPETGREADYARFAPLLLANFNSFAFDFVLRQKLQGQTLNLFIVEQLPLIRPEQFESSSGHQTLADFIRNEVLRLSYTAHDLAPFARDLSYTGAPFLWDEEDRRHRLARLDALFFQLYGLSRDDAAYILDQFPIVREQDQKAHGRYLTKDLILAYMNAIAAGDFTTMVCLER